MFLARQCDVGDDSGKWFTIVLEHKTARRVGYCAFGCLGHESSDEAIAHHLQYQLDRETDQFYAKRKIDVEPRFGHMKHNLRWKQFMRRGLTACRSEFRILCAAMNLSSLARWLESRELSVSEIPIS